MKLLMQRVLLCKPLVILLLLLELQPIVVVIVVVVLVLLVTNRIQEPIVVMLGCELGLPIIHFGQQSMEFVMMLLHKGFELQFAK